MEDDIVTEASFTLAPSSSLSAHGDWLSAHGDSVSAHGDQASGQGNSSMFLVCETHLCEKHIQADNGDEHNGGIEEPMPVVGDKVSPMPGDGNVEEPMPVDGNKASPMPADGGVEHSPMPTDVEQSPTPARFLLEVEQSASA